MMQSESDEEYNGPELDLEPAQKKNDKRLVLNHATQTIASEMVNRRCRKAELNRDIDPNNRAGRYPLNLKTK